MLNGSKSCTRPGFRDKVTRNKNNRKSPKRYHDAKWSELSKVRSVRKYGLSWQRVRSRSHENPYVQVHRHNQKRIVGATPLGDSNKQPRTTFRHATSFRFLIVYGYRDASSGVGGSNAPYVQREAQTPPLCQRKGSRLHAPKKKRLDKP